MRAIGQRLCPCRSGLGLGEGDRILDPLGMSDATTGYDPDAPNEVALQRATATSMITDD